MRNLPTALKLIILVVVALFLMGVSFVFSWFGMNTVTANSERIYSEKVAPLNLITSMSSDYSFIRVALRDLTQTEKTKQGVQITEINYVVNEFDKGLDDLQTQLQEINSTERLALLDEITVAWEVYQTRIQQVLAFVEAERNEQAGKMVREDMIHVARALSDTIDKIVAASLDESRVLAEESQQSSDRTIMFIMIVFAVAIVALGVVALFIILSIIKPTKVILNYLTDIANGDFENIKSTTYKDELGKMSRRLVTAVDSIKKLTADMQTISKEINQGDIDSRLDVEAFKGSYRDVATEYNEVVAGLTNDIVVFTNCMEKLARGDFDADIPKMPGKKSLMNDVRNVISQNLSNVTQDINMLVQSAIKGELKVSADVERYEGGWHDVIELINRLLSVVERPIADTVDALEQMAQGNLSIEITSEYTGEYKLIKDSVNSMCKMISSYIREISETLSQIAKNDISMEIKRDYIGDFAVIKTSINQIIANFNEVLGALVSAINQVAIGAQIILDSSNLVADGAAQQTVSIEEVGSEISEMDKKMLRVVSQASNATKLAGESTKDVLSGNEKMHQMLGAMGGIKDAADNISKINKVIEDIAFETNLLALNASVEAARAGEHGKGFSVVAGQVAVLAGRSQEAAQETRSLIETSIERVDEGTKIAKSTAEKLDTIAEGFSVISKIINGVSDMAEGQSRNIKELQTSMERISKVVQQNSATSEESASTSEELTGQVQNLKDMASQFRLIEDREREEKNVMDIFPEFDFENEDEPDEDNKEEAVEVNEVLEKLSHYVNEEEADEAESEPQEEQELQEEQEPQDIVV